MQAHGLLGDDAREEAPDTGDQLLEVPVDAFDAGTEDDDSGDRGLEMDGFNDPVDDCTGEIKFDDQEPRTALTSTAAVPIPPVQAEILRQTVGTGEPERKGPPPMFDSLEQWVHGWLLPLYRRSLDGSAVTFCREWWRHPEAYLRLDALWKSWEFMRRKPGTGMAVWLRDYCDYQMGVLMREQGTFKGCTIEAHNHEYALEPWVLAPMPTPRHIARLYDRLGVRRARPELESVQTEAWDGADQK